MPSEENAMFDLAKIAGIIRIRKFNRVVLQFPEELLQCCVSIYTILKNTLPTAQFFIVADSTYGSSVDEISAQHVQSDIIVSFDGDLSSSGSVPILVVPALKDLDMQEAVPFITSATKRLELDSGLPTGVITKLSIQLLYEPGFHHTMKSFVASACRELQFDESMVTIAKLPSCADLDRWCENSIECSDDIKLGDGIGGLYLALPIEKVNNCVDDSGHTYQEVTPIVGRKVVWYIGDKRQQLLSIMLRLGGTPVIAYSPSSRRVETMKGEELKEFMERYGGVSRVREADIVGIIVGSMGLNEIMTRTLVYRLEKLIRSAGKKHYTFVVGRLNEAKLCNFPEVDIYCLLSNDDDSMIKPKTFHVPVITPYELELGLGAHTWSSTYLNTSSRVYIGMDLNFLVNEVSKNLTEPMSDGRNENNIAQSGKKMLEDDINIEETRMIESFQSAAADHLLSREYRGMEFEISTTLSENLAVKHGRFGTASRYDRPSDIL